MSKVISFPKKEKHIPDPLELLNSVDMLHTVKADGTVLTVDMLTLKKVIDGKMPPSMLGDEVLRALLYDGVCNIVKNLSQQIDNIF